MFDTLLQNGTVVDGAGRKRFTADVGIEGDRITLVGPASGAPAQRTIDATGKIVCPGIVDPHSHADLSLFRNNQADLLAPLVKQGITTFVGGNCGMAMAPFGPTANKDVRNYIEIFTKLDFDKDVTWHTMGDYFDTVETNGLLLNAAVLAPHGILRLNAMGSAMRYATDDEIAYMARELDEALEQGAVGLSTGLQYFPGSQSDPRELLALGNVIKKHGAIFTSHLRSYTTTTLGRAIDEVAGVGDKCGIPVQISHLFAVPDFGIFGPPIRAIIRAIADFSKYWTPPLPLDFDIANALKRIMTARDNGVNIGVDIMPTTSGFTHILAFFPPWSVEGGSDAVLERLKNPDMRKKILHSIEHAKMEWPHTGPDAWTLNLFRLMGWECSRIMSVATDKNQKYVGARLVDIAKEQGKHPFDMACDLLLEENGHVLTFESMATPDDPFTERATYAGMRHPDAMISTDSILMGTGKPSSLFHGAYPHFLSRFVRDKKLLDLETGIRKMTGLAAEHFQLQGRGKIEPGAFADILVFDYDTLGTDACYLTPDVPPRGIEHVFINGKHIVEGPEFRPQHMPGKLLRATR